MRIIQFPAINSERMVLYDIVKELASFFDFLFGLPQHVSYILH